MEQIQILLAHHDTELARRFQAEVARHQSLQWQGAAASKAEILAACATNTPQIILLDNELDDASALDILQAVVESHSCVRIVGLSDSQDV